MKKLLISLTILIVTSAHANNWRVPDTGQTKCYSVNAEIPCPQPGEPYYGQDAQYLTNPQSFTKLDASGNELPDDAPWPWVMVRDNLTNLIWEVKTDDGGIHDKDNMYTWEEAQDIFINDLNSSNFGGHNDWRLPTVRELFLLSNWSNVDLFDPNSIMINTDYFPHIALDDSTDVAYYWSSQASLIISGGVFACTFEFYSHTMNIINTTIWPSFYALAVRGEELDNQFWYNGDGTTTDLSTGLMWRFEPFVTPYWSTALETCETSTYADYNDWRMPDVNELVSILDVNYFWPAIDQYFFQCPWDNHYASSTTGTRIIFSSNVLFSGGMVDNNEYKYCGINPCPKYIRPVRGGLCDDADFDAICDDGDNSGVVGDNMCTGGNRKYCDDNCIEYPNPDQSDVDGDGIGTVCDNCLLIPNGPSSGTCIGKSGSQGVIVYVGVNCTSNNDCDIIYPGADITSCQMNQEDTDSDGRGDVCDNCPSNYNPGQEDTYPPQGNGCGNACECEGNFDGDKDQDGTDAYQFNLDFGRSLFYHPCTYDDPCHGDFTCDGDVDGTDSLKFKEDFGRSSLGTPCPTFCVREPWCEY